MNQMWGAPSSALANFSHRPSSSGSQPRSLKAEEADEGPHPSLYSQHPLQVSAGKDYCSWRQASQVLLLCDIGCVHTLSESFSLFVKWG